MRPAFIKKNMEFVLQVKRAALPWSNICSPSVLKPRIFRLAVTPCAEKPPRKQELPARVRMKESVIDAFVLALSETGSAVHDGN
jgi:hypothetical protein